MTQCQRERVTPGDRWPVFRKTFRNRFRVQWLQEWEELSRFKDHPCFVIHAVRAEVGVVSTLSSSVVRSSDLGLELTSTRPIALHELSSEVAFSVVEQDRNRIRAKAWFLNGRPGIIEIFTGKQLPGTWQEL